MPFEPRIVLIVVDQGLKAWITTDWLLASSFDVVNIIVVQEPEVWRGAWCPAFWLRNELFFGSRYVLWRH